jgi:hypothetical protein
MQLLVCIFFTKSGDSSPAIFDLPRFMNMAVNDDLRIWEPYGASVGLYHTFGYDTPTAASVTVVEVYTLTITAAVPLKQKPHPSAITSAYHLGASILQPLDKGGGQVYFVMVENRHFMVAWAKHREIVLVLIKQRYPASHQASKIIFLLVFFPDVALFPAPVFIALHGAKKVSKVHDKSTALFGLLQVPLLHILS